MSRGHFFYSMFCLQIAYFSSMGLLGPLRGA
jgi:hypothetical protein